MAIYRKRRTLNLPPITKLPLPPPIVLAWLVDADIYVTDQWNHNLVIFDNMTASARSAAAANPPLGTPTSIALDAYGRVYISDTTNGAILSWPSFPKYLTDTTGALCTWLTPANSMFAYKVIVDWEGQNLYVADTGNNRVLQIPTATSNYPAMWNVCDTSSTGDTFKSPTGISFAPNGFYVADNENKRVVYLPGIGQGLEWAVYSGANPLNYTWDVSIDENNFLCIVDNILSYSTFSQIYAQNPAQAGGRVLRMLDITGAAWQASTQTNTMFVGVCAGAYGIYVTNLKGPEVRLYQDVTLPPIIQNCGGIFQQPTGIYVKEVLETETI